MNSIKMTSEKFSSPHSSNNIEFRDIAVLPLNLENSYYQKCIRIEIDKLRPNYGSASDLLRLIILDNYGGAYYDSDVNAFPLEGLKIWNMDDAFYMHKKSYNDIIVCNKNNKILEKLITKIKENYVQIASPIKDILYDSYLSDNPLYIILRTINKTGPNIINTIGDSKEIKELNELRNNRANAESDQSWCGRGIKKLYNIKDINILIDRIIENVIFEIKSTKILRLEDHVYAFLESIDENNVNKRETHLKDFLDKIKTSIIINEVNYAQLTFNHPAVFSFYRENNLLNKTFLLPWDNRYIGNPQETFLIYENLTNIHPQNVAATHDFISIFKICCSKAYEVKDMQNSVGRMLPKMTQSLYLENFSDYLDFAANYIKKIDSDDDIQAALVDLEEIVEAKLKFLIGYNHVYEQYWLDKKIPLFIKFLEEKTEVHNNILSDIRNLKLKSITKDDYEDFYEKLKEKSLLGNGEDEEKLIEFFTKVLISAAGVPVTILDLIQSYVHPSRLTHR